jgi:hypothetical protein
MCDIKKVVLPEGYHLRIKHLHPGNSSRSQRHGHKYMTIAKIYDGPTLVAKAKAQCSKQDHPSRALGREIAVGRVLKKAGVK